MFWYAKDGGTCATRTLPGGSADGTSSGFARDVALSFFGGNRIFFPAKKTISPCFIRRFVLEFWEYLFVWIHLDTIFIGIRFHCIQQHHDAFLTKLFPHDWITAVWSLDITITMSLYQKSSFNDNGSSKISHVTNDCWWFRNPANQLRLVVYPFIYSGFIYIQNDGFSSPDFHQPTCYQRTEVQVWNSAPGGAKSLVKSHSQPPLRWC